MAAIQIVSEGRRHYTIEQKNLDGCGYKFRSQDVAQARELLERLRVEGEQ
jgi:hypothetical protein